MTKGRAVSIVRQIKKILPPHVEVRVIYDPDLKDWGVLVRPYQYLFNLFSNWGESHKDSSYWREEGTRFFRTGDKLTLF